MHTRRYRHHISASSLNAVSVSTVCSQDVYDINANPSFNAHSTSDVSPKAVIGILDRQTCPSYAFRYSSTRTLSSERHHQRRLAGSSYPSSDSLGDILTARDTIRKHKAICYFTPRFRSSSPPHRAHPQFRRRVHATVGYRTKAQWQQEPFTRRTGNRSGSGRAKLGEDARGRQQQLQQSLRQSRRRPEKQKNKDKDLPPTRGSRNAGPGRGGGEKSSSEPEGHADEQYADTGYEPRGGGDSDERRRLRRVPCLAPSEVGARMLWGYSITSSSKRFSYRIDGQLLLALSHRAIQRGTIPEQWPQQAHLYQARCKSAKEKTNYRNGTCLRDEVCRCE